MFTNLPKKFPLELLEQFTIGDVEPESDSLLDHSLGICKINPVLEFLKGKKSLIVGQRGSGKTTLFKLVSEGKLNFFKKTTHKYLILPINETLDYSEIKNKIFDVFQTTQNDVEKCRIFWEIYLVFRILLKLQDELSELTGTLAEHLRNIKIILGYEEKKVGIKDILTTLRYTGGLKISQSYAGITLTPHIALERSDSLLGKQNVDLFNIETCKKELNEFLDSKKYRIFILIDNLDEFVVTEDYAFQTKLIQGLLESEKSYIKYSNIRLKLFLRSDLFDRLNFETLGYEKIMSRKIDLTWTSSDIRRLIAQRITINYLNLFNLKQLELLIDTEKLFLDETSVEETYKNSIKSMTLFESFKKFFRHPSKHYNRDIRTGRHINFNDAINRAIISSIFPRKVKHRLGSGKYETCDFTDFCETHLCLSKKLLTPRILIMFLEKCFEHIINYYREKPRYHNRTRRK